METTLIELKEILLNLKEEIKDIKQEIGKLKIKISVMQKSQKKNKKLERFETIKTGIIGTTLKNQYKNLKQVATMPGLWKPNIQKY